MRGSARSRAAGQWLAGLVGLVLLVGGPGTAAAAGRHAAMVIDANTGRVLHAQAADEPRYPASLTKLMTLYLVFEAIEQGRASPTTRIRISPTAAATAPSKLGLEAGSDIALRDAVKILIVKSANDIAVAIAEHIAGSEAKFATLMTRKAHQIGMTATTFRNAHGLPDSGQITTARDMLTLALRLNDDFAKYYSLFAMRTFSYGGASYRNHNTMLGSYAGMDGLKTGYTTSSGFNLVASVRRDGRHVVAVVFGGATAGTRNAHMRAILDRTLPRASTQRTRRQVPVAHAPPARPQAPERVVRAEPKPQAQPRLVEPVRPVAQPMPAHKPGPARAERVAPPRPAEPAALPQPAPPQPAPLAVPEPPASPGAPIVIAKVRPVTVTPVPRRVVRQRAHEPASVTPVAQTPPAAPAAKAPPAAPFPMAEEPPSGRPLPPGQRFALGAPPSTLQAQAERISLGQPPAPARPPAAALPRPAPQATPAAPARPTRPAAVAQGPMIQIGAYANEAEAQRRLAAVQALLAAPLNGARPVTQRVSVAGRTLYRARFSGLDAVSAAKVCNELRRQQVDCLVTAGP